jgi:hypothetical protein
MSATYVLEQSATTVLANAANEDFPRDPLVLTKIRNVDGGWDPYEVWHTRVHLEQRRLGLLDWDKSPRR